MNADRRTLVLSWLTVVGFVVVTSLWERSKLPARYSTDIFATASIFTIACALFTAQELKRIQSRSANFKQILQAELWARLWLGCVLALEVIISLTFLLRGKDVGVLVPNVLALWLAAMLPISAPLIVSQIRLFRCLGSEAE